MSSLSFLTAGARLGGKARKQTSSAQKVAALASSAGREAGAPGDSDTRGAQEPSPLVPRTTVVNGITMSYVFAGRGKDMRKLKTPKAARGADALDSAPPNAVDPASSPSSASSPASSQDDDPSSASDSSEGANRPVNLIDPETREELGPMILDPHRVFAFRQVVRDTAKPPTLVFCANSRRALAVLRELNLAGWPSSYVLGGMKKSEKTAELRKLRRGETWAVVCTDKAIRGLEVPKVAVAISFDAPERHLRSGCRRRAGFVKEGGDAVVLFTDREIRELR